MYSVDWDGFKRWLFETHRSEWANHLYCAARKYYAVLWLSGEAACLSVLSDCSRRLVMASLSNLSRYLGMYKDWKSIVENVGLKWSNENNEDMLIDRFTRVKDPNEIVSWICLAKEKSPSLSSFLDFAAFTGIRFVEAVDSVNLIVALKQKDSLPQYYNVDRALLEHYKYREIFFRGPKKVFVSFVSPTLISHVQDCKPMSKIAVIRRLQKANLPLKFGDLREYWATVMTRHLSQPEIDLLQGRVSSSVFMRNYFNPAWITDLQTRTLKAEGEILAKIC